jgi:hypothetical protein
MDFSFTESLSAIAKRDGVSMDELAKASGQTRQNLYLKFQKGDLKESEARKLADIMGYKIKIEFYK